MLPRFLQFNSLKSRAVVASTGGVVAVLLIVGAIQMHFMRADLAQLLAKQQFLAVSHMAQDLDAKIDGERNVLMRLAAGLPLDRLHSSEALMVYLKERPALLASFDGVGVIAPSGQILAQVPASEAATLEDADLIDVEHVKSTLRPWIGTPSIDRVNLAPAVHFMVPLVDGNRRFAGVLLGVVTLENLLATAQRAKPGQTGDFIVVTRVGWSIRTARSFWRRSRSVQRGRFPERCGASKARLKISDWMDNRPWSATRHCTRWTGFCSRIFPSKRFMHPSAMPMEGSG